MSTNTDPKAQRRAMFALAGGVTKLAERLDESPQTVSNWIDRGVPVNRCADVEAATAGQIRRWHLRPGDWHVIWPELRRKKGAPPISTEPTPAEQG